MIPKLAHFIWLGEAVPDWFTQGMMEFKRLHPEWESLTWTNETASKYDRDLASWPFGQMACRSDVLRLLLLRDFGGCYADGDFTWNKNIDSILNCQEGCFAGWSDMGSQRHLNNAIIGATPHHPAVLAAIEALPKWLEEMKKIGRTNPAVLTGPYFLTAQWIKRYDVQKLPYWFFYPYSPTEVFKAEDSFSESYAIHRWRGSWMENDLSAEDKLAFLGKKLRKALAECARLRAVLAHDRNSQVHTTIP